MRSRWKLNGLLLLLLTGVGAALRFFRLTQFPPGLHFDEAFHQVEAIGVLNGYRPVYFAENMGMDPMHIYLVAVLYRLIGVSEIGGRIVSAIAGTLTLPALWWLAQELSAGWDQRLRTALSASSVLVLATLQWHITFSRTGIQPVLVPLLLTLTMGALWRGLRTGHWGWFIVAGLSMGAGPYAYSASRFVPLLVVGLVLWLLAFERETLRSRWKGLLLSVAVSVVVFAPLGLYFYKHPQWFTLRASQVTSATLGQGSGAAQALGENAVKTLASFTFRGDRDPIRNLPGRPALDLFQSLLFAAGIGLCLRNVRRPAYAAPLLWLGVMLLPTVLTEYAPHFGRSLGATPAVALLVGLGTATVWRGIGRFAASRADRTRSVVRSAAAVALCAGLIASAGGHIYSYFMRWGTSPDLYLPYDVSLFAASKAVRERVPEAEVYLSPISVGHPILRFMTWDRPGARSYDGRYSLVLSPPRERPVDYVIVSTMDRRSLARLQDAYPGGTIVDRGVYEGEVPYYQVYRVPPGSEAHLAPQHTVEIVWDDRIEQFGYDLGKERYRPGEDIVLTTYWRSHVPMEEAYTVFTHLVGPGQDSAGGAVWAGSDHEPGRGSYPTPAWQPGEVIVDEFVLSIPADTPPGEYSLEVGFYQWHTLQRLPVSYADVEAGADHAILAKITVGD